jgi:hypothetical protein
MQTPGKVTTLTIGGVDYRIAQPGGRTGARLLFRGGQIFAQALAEGFSTKGMDPTIGTLLALARRLPMADFDWLCDEMAALTEYGHVDTLGGVGKVTFTPLAPVYDEHFRGRYEVLAEWLKGAVESAFGPFVVDLQRKMEEYKTSRTASASASPKAATGSGSSGDSSSASA